MKTYATRTALHADWNSIAAIVRALTDALEIANRCDSDERLTRLEEEGNLPLWACSCSVYGHIHKALDNVISDTFGVPLEDLNVNWGGNMDTFEDVFVALVDMLEIPFDPEGQFDSVEQAIELAMKQPDPYAAATAIVMANIECAEYGFASEVVSEMASIDYRMQAHQRGTTVSVAPAPAPVTLPTQFIERLSTFEAGEACAVDFVHLHDERVLGINGESVVLYANMTAFHQDSPIIPLPHISLED